jgi:thiazole synthase
MADRIVIAGREFRSRLFVGTGKYRSNQEMARCHEASGAEVVTVAVRRVNLTDRSKESMLDYLDRSKYFLLPNTAGCYTADEAIRAARLAREAGLSGWVKLEVIGDERTLFPDNQGLLEATRVLVKEGFTVLPYINADPVLAKRLQEVGCATVMPLGAPIGSNRGIQTRDQIRIIIEQATVPVVVDAGIGAPSHAAEAMEMGADAVLVNTAIAVAGDANRMAIAFKQAVEAGRTAFEIGLGAQSETSSATSPLTGFLN